MPVVFKDAIAIATGVAGIAASAVAAIRYFAKKEQLEGDLRRMQERYDELAGRYREIVEIIGNVKVSGSAALLLKSEMDTQLELATKSLQATASSILIPLPGKSRTNLVFLAARGPVASQLRRTIIPADKGIAGYVFNQGKSYLATDAVQDREFFRGIDVLSSYTTKDVLCVPIHGENGPIGVLQFLNRESGPFTEPDLRIAERFAASLAERVAQFAADPQNFELLGFAPAEIIRDGAIVFCDLTASSLLIDALNFSVGISLLNAYLEKASDIVMQHGGTVDKFLGDGAMFRFNVPHEISDWRMQAIRATLAMRSAFELQKDMWSRAGMPVNALFTRIGIASGPVREAIMGHPQFQSLTVMGEPVVLAASLCSGAPRDRNVVLTTAETIKGLEHQIGVKPLPIGLLKKIKGRQPSAFELLSCNPASASLLPAAKY